jgi:hypothetical protein
MPARILQHLLQEKWKLESGDKDMIVIQHQFEFLQESKLNSLQFDCEYKDMIIHGYDSRKPGTTWWTCGLFNVRFRTLCVPQRTLY